jgi:hypothetical protein
MKKILVCGTALSLLLLACGDDSSSGPDPVTGGNESGTEIDSSASQIPESSGMGAVSKADDDKSSSSTVPASSETIPGSSAGVPESSNGTSPESSGGTTPESSSSVLAPTQNAKDIVADCNDGLDENNAVSPAPADTVVKTLLVEVEEDGPGATPPVAYKYYGSDGFVTYVAERVMMPCGISITGITVSAVGDTLFAKVSVDPDAPITNCICNTRVSFKIEKDSRFTQATRLVIDDNRLMTYRIVSERIDPVVDDKIQNRVLAGKCMVEETASEKLRIYGAAPAASNPLYANLVQDPEGFYYLQVEDIEANCGIGQAKMVQEMQGDTLFMKYDSSSELLRCMCVFDELKFVVSDENVNATYFSFSGIVYKIARLQKSF